MQLNRLRTLLFCIPLASSACSGGGSGSMPQNAPVSQANVPLSVTLHIPAASATQSAFRVKQYISAGTLSAKLTATTNANTATSATTNCSTSCSLALQVAPGPVTLSVALYSGLNQAGAVLSSATAPEMIVAGQQNTISMSLGGTVATIQLTTDSSAFTLGTAASTNVHVTALDAAGDQIIGSDAFTTPISLALGNAASEFALGATSVTTPANGIVALNFNGGSVAANPTITATVNGTALTASTAVTTHSAVILPSEPAVSANAFVDSIGMNTHFSYPQYANQFEVVRGLLVNLGIHHIRDGFAVSTPATGYWSNLDELLASGMHGDMITGINMPTSLILANVVGAPNFTESIEAPNEYDVSGDPQWATNLAAYQQTLYTGAKATPQLAALPILGPALTSIGAYSQLGNLSSFMDKGNMHNYFLSFNPGTPGWGGPGFGSLYGSIKYNQGAAAQLSGSKPITATETGYCTVSNNLNDVSNTVQSRYTPRLFLEQWRANVPRTFLYEFIDEGLSGCDGAYGLLTTNLSPKPAYYSLQSLIQTLGNATANYSPSVLPLALTTSTASVHHILFEKPNGTYVLAVWNEIPSSSIANGIETDLTPAPVAVTLQLTANPSTSSIGSIGDDGSLHAGSLTWASGTAPLSIDDHVTLITLTP